jgi:hypothetical protein
MALHMTQANRVLSTPPTNTSAGETFEHVCHYLNGLMIISETIDEPHGGAINEMVWTMQDKMKELQREYSTLFKLTHPDRERFERDGWPGDEGVEP